MDKDKNEALNFASSLKMSKNLYVECPHCNEIFGLYGQKIFYGKSPPKDILTSSLRLIEKYKHDIKSALSKHEEEIEMYDDRLSDANDKYRQIKSDYTNFKKNKALSMKEIIDEKKKMAIQRSRASVHGHLAELIPTFRKTNINPLDLCVLIPTRPLDFIVFRGLYGKEVTSITFLDVKSGGARLNPIQKSIKNVVSDGKIGFETLRVNFDVKANVSRES